MAAVSTMVMAGAAVAGAAGTVAKVRSAGRAADRATKDMKRQEKRAIETARNTALADEFINQTGADIMIGTESTEESRQAKRRRSTGAGRQSSVGGLDSPVTGGLL